MSEACSGSGGSASTGMPFSCRIQPRREVEIGEASVVIAVSAPHRSAALDACREAIETLKATIPLWKKEVYAGGEEWVGRGS